MSIDVPFVIITTIAALAIISDCVLAPRLNGLPVFQLVWVVVASLLLVSMIRVYGEPVIGAVMVTAATIWCAYTVVSWRRDVGRRRREREQRF